MRTFAFIDASNLFYGGQKSLGWKIDYEKLSEYLKNKYQAERVFYFGGVEMHKFSYDYLNNHSVPLRRLERYLTNIIVKKGNQFNEAYLLLISRHLQRVRFYLKLEQFGYELYLKPVKIYYQDDGVTRKKANCDVEMALYLMKEKDSYDRVIILSGDGDFLPVLKYLREIRKQVIILSRSSRTAREIRKFSGSDFRDFEYLKYLLKIDGE